jgi:hypothetical protein
MSEGFFQPHNADEDCTTPGGGFSSDRRSNPGENGGRACNGLGLGSQRYLLSNGPHKRTQFPGDGHDYLVGILPSGDELPIAFTQADLGLPTEVLDRLGHFL